MEDWGQAFVVCNPALEEVELYAVIENGTKGQSEIIKSLQIGQRLIPIFHISDKKTAESETRQ